MNRPLRQRHWLLLCVGWGLFGVALLLPGMEGPVYSPSTWLVMETMLEYPWRIWEFAGAGDYMHALAVGDWMRVTTILTAWGAALALYVFVLSPVYVLLAGRFRSVARCRWLFGACWPSGCCRRWGGMAI